MNFAFQALTFLLLLLPGALFLYTHYGKLAGGKDLPIAIPFTARTVIALVMAGALHAAWVPISNSVSNHWGIKVDLSSVLFFLIGQYDQHELYKTAIRSITDWPYFVLAYFISLYAVPK